MSEPRKKNGASEVEINIRPWQLFLSQAINMTNGHRQQITAFASSRVPMHMRNARGVARGVSIQNWLVQSGHLLLLLVAGLDGVENFTVVSPLVFYVSRVKCC